MADGASSRRAWTICMEVSGKGRASDDAAQQEEARGPEERHEVTISGTVEKGGRNHGYASIDARGGAGVGASGAPRETGPGARGQKNTSGPRPHDHPL